MAEEIVIFDIDGILADISQRVHHIRRKPKNWNAFNEGMAKDKAIRSMVRLCNILYASGLYIVLCSGRNEKTVLRPSNGSAGKASIIMSCCSGKMKIFVQMPL